jgi:hypothetical protein
MVHSRNEAAIPEYYLGMPEGSGKQRLNSSIWNIKITLLRS